MLPYIMFFKYVFSVVVKLLVRDLIPTNKIVPGNFDNNSA